MALKRIHREIKELNEKNYPFNYKLEIVDEFPVTVVVNLSVPTPQQSYEIVKITFFFSQYYPFKPPLVLLDRILPHPMLIGTELNMCDFGPVFGLHVLVAEIYCILLEAFDECK